jgi:hypothetical protein
VAASAVPADPSAAPHEAGTTGVDWVRIAGAPAQAASTEST